MPPSKTPKIRSGCGAFFVGRMMSTATFNRAPRPSIRYRKCAVTVFLMPALITLTTKAVSPLRRGAISARLVWPILDIAPLSWLPGTNRVRALARIAFYPETNPDSPPPQKGNNYCNTMHDIRLTTAPEARMATGADRPRITSLMVDRCHRPCLMMTTSLPAYSLMTAPLIVGIK